MRAYIIVFLDEVRNTLPEFFGAVVFININLLRLERAEPPLNHDIVRPPGLAVHTLADVLAFKISFIFFTGKLTALVAVQDGGHTNIFSKYDIASSTYYPYATEYPTLYERYMKEFANPNNEKAIKIYDLLKPEREAILGQGKT